MDYEKLDRQLRLIAALAQNRTRTVDEIGEQLKLNRRSVYRYIDTFRQTGFVVKNQGSIYSLEHDSPFFLQISRNTHLTDDEAQTLCRFLDTANDNSPRLRHLRKKLSSLYDFKTPELHSADEHIARNIEAIFIAIREERVAILRDYQSHNSESVSDRVVEPFLLLNGSGEVRCHELVSGLNKTFKMGRCSRVDVLDLLWSNKEKHKAFFTDIFHFSGEERERVRLRFGNFVRSLLLEDYPAAEIQLHDEGGGSFLLDTEVCSFKGIGRFVIGLAEDIEIVDSPNFEHYLAEKARFLTQKFCE